MEEQIKQNIDFILSHFEIQHELFPRTIMTSQTRGQKGIAYETDEQQSKNKIFEIFKNSKYVDCKINAFSYNTEHSINFDVKNKTAATFMMIDLDLNEFQNNKQKLDKQLEKTLKKISTTFLGEANPTVLWTGNGYHIYQPIRGIIFEEYETFYKFLPYLDGKDLTTEFLRFAEKYFTDDSSDPNHMPSIKSCLIRVPGTFNHKNGKEVRIIQRWDGKMPAIQWVTTEYHAYLIQKRIDKINERKRRQTRKKLVRFNYTNKNRIQWIENLLNTPIEDNRKYCLWRILCPYLVNIRRLDDDESTAILNDWLKKCDSLRKLDFNPAISMRNYLKNVKTFLPPSKEILSKEGPELYSILKSRNIDT